MRRLKDSMMGGENKISPRVSKVKKEPLDDLEIKTKSAEGISISQNHVVKDEEILDHKRKRDDNCCYEVQCQMCGHRASECPLVQCQMCDQVGQKADRCPHVYNICKECQNSKRPRTELQRGESSSPAQQASSPHVHFATTINWPIIPEKSFAQGFQNHPAVLYPRMTNRGWNRLAYTTDSEYDERAVRRFYGRLHETESGSLMWRRTSGEDVAISPDTIEQALHLVEPPSRAQQFHHADENIEMLAGRLILPPENPNVSFFPCHRKTYVRIGSMRGNQQVVAFWYNTNIHPSKKPTDVFIPCLHVLDVLQNNKPNFSIAQDIASTIKLGREKRRCLLPMVVTEWMRSWKELGPRASGTWKKVKNWAESSTLNETRALPAWSAAEKTRWQEHLDELAEQAAQQAAPGVPDGGDDPLDPDQAEIDSERRILTALGHVRAHITSRADQTDAKIQAVIESVAALEKALAADRASLLTGIRELFQNMVQSLACGTNSMA